MSTATRPSLRWSEERLEPELLGAPRCSARLGPTPAWPVRRAKATVLVDELGAPVRPERFGGELQHAMKYAGMPVIRPYDVRHTFATLAPGAGMPVHEVAAWLGRDPAACLRTYAHAIPSRLAGVAAAVRRIGGMRVKRPTKSGNDAYAQNSPPRVNHPSTSISQSRCFES